MAFTPRRLMRGASGASTGYQIARSLRFNSADSPYLSRTPGSTSSQTTATFSAWVKRSRLSGSDDNRLFSESTGSGDGIFWVLFNPSDQLQIYTNGSGVGLVSTQVFRDPSAWYHVVVAVDTTQATNSNRIKIYVNNVQITAFTGTQTYYTQGQTLKFNVTSSTNYIGYSNSQAFGGYMTEVNWIDGQALTPSSFGETNADTGVWQPKRYSGSYGTNGFYLNFSDNSNTTAATLGKDYSGNGNNFTPNNFSVTAGVGNDSMVDVPTPYGIDTGVGGTVRGNYATINPYQLISNVSVSNGNLYLQSNNNADQFASAPSTIAVRTGKWYAEFTASAVSGTPNYVFGVARAEWSPIILDGSGYYGRFYVSSGGVATGYGYHSNGNFYTNNTYSISGATYVSGDIIGVAMDLDTGSITFYKNGVSQGTPFTSIPLGVDYVFAGGAFTYSYPTPTNIGAFFANFGQRPFAYTAPSGFKALCTQNLPTPTIGATTATQAGKYFNTVLYTGNGTSSARSITGVGFQPDFVWGKGRSVAAQHNLFDVVRGSGKRLISNSSASEESNAAYGYLSSFDSDGFSTSPGSTNNENWNQTSETYVAWNWKAGGTAVTNTSGQISSQVSANPTAGFSIVTFTADGTTKTVGHGLGVKPSLVIAKVRNGAGSWITITDVIDGTMKYAALQTDGAFASIGYSAPTSSVFSYNDNNTNTQVAYCFASIEGFSKIGVYTGNASSDGPFVYTGFRPAWVLFKGTTSGTNWFLFDSKRSTYNIVINLLYPNGQNVENTAGSGYLDLTSNGFKIRTTAGDMNQSYSYIYMAFAENPFKYSLAR